MIPTYGFGKDARLRNKKDFARLKTRGRKLYAPHFLIVLDRSPSEASRLAVAVTKKLEPSAARRNLLRRRLKDFFRLTRHQFAGSFDILIIARKDALSCQFNQIREELFSAMERGGIIKPASQ